MSLRGRETTEAISSGVGIASSLFGLIAMTKVAKILLPNLEGAELTRLYLYLQSFAISTHFQAGNI